MCSESAEKLGYERTGHPRHIWHGFNRWHLRIWQPPPHEETLQTSDTEEVEQTTEGGMRRQIITALAPPTPGRTTPYYLAWHDYQSHTRKATIKARMTTGWYILQGDVKRLNQNEVNATCLLCDIGEPENIDHFLCRCSYPPIKDSRERFLPRLIRLLHTALGFERLDEHSEHNVIVQLVLYCTAYDSDESHTHDTAWLALGRHAREYCYQLHRLRYAVEKEIRGSQPCRSRLPHRTTWGRPLPCDINLLLTAAAY